MNIVMVWMAANGGIHPPWGVLGLFSLIGPVLNTVLIFINKIFIKNCSWLYVMIVTTIMAIAFIVNANIFVTMSALV